MFSELGSSSDDFFLKLKKGEFSENIHALPVPSAAQLDVFQAPTAEQVLQATEPPTEAHQPPTVDRVLDFADVLNMTTNLEATAPADSAGDAHAHDPALLADHGRKEQESKIRTSTREKRLVNKQAEVQEVQVVDAAHALKRKRGGQPGPRGKYNSKEKKLAEGITALSGKQLGEVLMGTAAVNDLKSEEKYQGDVWSPHAIEIVLTCVSL